jgi:DNA-binding response OmpR family regulator
VGAVGGQLVSQDGDRAGARILVVDDDRDLIKLLAFLVDQAGFTALTATEPSAALELFAKQDPSVAIVDLNLERGDGFELVTELRRLSPKLPILVLTGRASEDDKVRALDAGADDYVVKPFGHRELVARIRAHARRANLDRNGPLAHATLEVGALRLDLREHVLEIGDEDDLRLTATEFRLLEYLMRNHNTVVPTGALTKHVWGYDDGPARDVVRVTVHRLRRKLGEDGTRRFIETVPGIGLKLRPVLRQEKQRSL